MNPLAPVPSLSSHPYPLQQSWSRQLERHITNASAAIAPWRTKRENFWWFKPTYSENFWCLIEENFISMWKLLSIDFVWRWRLMVYYLKRFTCFNINHKISEIIHTFECLPLRGVPMRTFSHGRHQTTFFRLVWAAKSYFCPTTPSSCWCCRSIFNLLHRFMGISRFGWGQEKSTRRWRIYRIHQLRKKRVAYVSTVEGSTSSSKWQDSSFSEIFPVMNVQFSRELSLGANGVRLIIAFRHTKRTIRNIWRKKRRAPSLDVMVWH